MRRLHIPSFRDLRRIEIPSLRDMNKIVLGIVAILLVGGVVGGALAVGTLGLFQSRYQVLAVFSDSSGLAPGSPVRVAGIQVGQVTSLNADYRAGDVEVVCQIDDNVPLGPSTRAAIDTATLLGSDFVALTGTQGGPLLQNEPTARRVIPLARTTVPYTVTDALNTATSTLQQLNLTTLQAVINQIGTTLGDASSSIGPLVHDFALLSEAVAQRKDMLAELVSNTQELSATLSSRDQQLDQLIGEAETLLQAVDQRRQELETVLGSGSDVVNQLADTLQAKQAQIESVLNDLQSTLADTTTILPQINSGLAYAAPTFGRLAAAVGPSYFNIEITGFNQLSLNNLNHYLSALLGSPS